jgi:hypothetical protein
MAARALPPELVSLVHHTELNKAGWWNKTIQQLIMSALWLSGEPLSTQRLVDNLRNILHIDIDAIRVGTQVEQMLKAGTLVSLGNGDLKIGEEARRQLERDVKQTDELNARVKARFATILADCCPGLSGDEEWHAFNGEFMQPLIQEIGARTYQLISGMPLDLEKTTRFPAYLQEHPSDQRQGLRAAIVKFLEPRDADVRSFVLRHLNAYFSVEAGALRAETVDSLMRMIEKPPSFKIFVDTNFLLSFLELRDNPSNEAAKSLVGLTRQLAGKALCRFYVSPLTLDEFKSVVEGQRDFLRGLNLPPNLAAVALEVDLSGVARRFIEFSTAAGHPVSAEAYFEPYLLDLVPTLRHKNVEFFNESMDRYSSRQDVIDDILAQLAYEKKRFRERAKSYGQLRHDVVLWHFVHDKRPARVESPIDATHWIVTVDYHYMSFDEFKRRGSRNSVPICLHPTSLIQMLQFWLPRTQEFEEAILDSMRLPLLFQEFDASAEKVSVGILETLARFENADQLPKEVVGHILVNRALRQELALEQDLQRQVDLIKGAVVEETEKIHSQLRATADERDRLAQALEKHQRDIDDLKEQLAESERRTGQMTAATNLHPSPLSQPGSGVGIRHQDTHHAAYFASAAILSLALVFALSLLGLVWWRPTFGIWRTGVVIWSLSLVLWAILVNRLGERNEVVKSRVAFQKFVRYRKELFAVIGFALLWDLFEFVKGLIVDWGSRLLR